MYLKVKLPLFDITTISIFSLSINKVTFVNIILPKYINGKLWMEQEYVGESVKQIIRKSA
jgi:hypothetical protein